MKMSKTKTHNQLDTWNTGYVLATAITRSLWPTYVHLSLRRDVHRPRIEDMNGLFFCPIILYHPFP